MPGVGDALFDASSCVACRLADHVQSAVQIEDTRHATETRQMTASRRRSGKITLHSLVLSFFTLLPIYWKLDKTFGQEKRSKKRFKNLTWRDTVDDVDLMLQSAVLCATIRALKWLQRAKMHLWHSSLNYKRQLERIRSGVRTDLTRPRWNYCADYIRPDPCTCCTRCAPCRDHF